MNDPKFPDNCASERRNNYDVTNRINTTDPTTVSGEINRIFVNLYPGKSTSVLNRAFKDLVLLHHGDYPGYRACDTGYHNLQHTLDVTLAMARLMDGYERPPDRGEARGHSPSVSSRPCFTTSATCTVPPILGTRMARNTRSNMLGVAPDF